MNFKTVLAAGVSCLAVASIFAAGANAAGSSRDRYAGTISLGYSYTDFNIDGIDDTSVDTFSGSGAVVFNLEGNYYAQADFAFASHSLGDDFTGPIDISLDTWKAGGEVFWRDPSVGMFGVELAYQSADLGISGDGFRAGVRGEYYFSDKFTLGAAVGYQELSVDPFLDADGWYVNAKATYYVNDKVSVSLNANYFTLDLGLSSDVDQWSVGAEAEYLISKETPVSVYGGVRYGQYDIDNASFDNDETTVYVGVKFRFGNEGGSLKDQDRNGALTPTTTGYNSPFQM